MKSVLLSCLIAFSLASPLAALDLTGAAAQAQGEFERKSVEFDQEMQRQERQRIKRRDTSTSFESCYSGDTCFSIVETSNNGATIQCIKGHEVGSEKCLSKNDEGKWASGCGAIYMFAHHYSFERAANIACGQ